MYIYSKSVHTNACINILRCFGYPREHNFGLVLILSPTGCTEGCVYFPQSCRNTHLPHFLDCLLNTTLIPCLLVCFLSILHERVCDYSGVQSSATGILRMGDMNIHITWLTHVRTRPPPKKSPPGHFTSKQTVPSQGGQSTSRGVTLLRSRVSGADSLKCPGDGLLRSNLPPGTLLRGQVTA